MNQKKPIELREYQKKSVDEHESEMLKGDLDLKNELDNLKKVVFRIMDFNFPDLNTDIKHYDFITDEIAETPLLTILPGFRSNMDNKNINPAFMKSFKRTLEYFGGEKQFWKYIMMFRNIDVMFVQADAIKQPENIYKHFHGKTLFHISNIFSTSSERECKSNGRLRTAPNENGEVRIIR